MAALTARLWDPGTRRDKAVLTGHTSGVEAMAFSPAARLPATAGRDGTIRFASVTPR